MRIEREDGHAIVRCERLDEAFRVAVEVHLAGHARGVSCEVGLDDYDEETAGSTG